MSNPRKAALAAAFLALAISGTCFARPQDPRDSEIISSDPATASARESAAAPTAQLGPPPRAGNADNSNRFAIGVQVSTLGIGPEFAFRLSHRLNVRAGANFMSFSHTITQDQITYAAQLHFRSAEAHLDWFFLGPLHLSPGVLLYNGNGISAAASVPTGQVFTLDGTEFESGTPPLGGSASLTLNKIAPSILFGIGNMIPRNGHHFAGQFEIGAIYEGSPNIALNFTGTVCSPPASSGPTCQSVSVPQIQSLVTAEQSQANHDVTAYKFYPIISGGFSVAF